MSNGRPWFLKGRRSADEVQIAPPLRYGSHSMGEYFHDDETARERRLARAITAAADHGARRLGLEWRPPTS
jgi:hypothetical protein